MKYSPTFLEFFLNGCPGLVTCELESISFHLKKLFNTRNGNCFDLEYGLDDISIFYEGLPNSVDLLKWNIKKLVNRYEPRIDDVEVEWIEQQDPACLVGFYIAGHLRSNGEKLVFKIQFFSDMDIGVEAMIDVYEK